jgi:Fe-S-cluster containining protein
MHKLKQYLIIIESGIPPSTCKGLCQAFCGPQFFTNTEWARIPEELRGKRLNLNESKHAQHAREKQFYKDQPVTAPACEYLKEGKCSIYSYRPMVCRTWGQVDIPAQRCPFDCVPTLTEEQFHTILEAYVHVMQEDGTVEDFMDTEETSDNNLIQIYIECKCGAPLYIGTNKEIFDLIHCGGCGRNNEFTENQLNYMYEQIAEKMRED